MKRIAPLHVLLGALCLWSCRQESHPKDTEVASQSVAAEVAPRLGAFEDGLSSGDGAKWKGVNDEGAGGSSTITVEGVEGGAAGTKRALHIKGHVKLADFPFPFAGARVPFGAIVNGEATPLSIKNYQGLEFWAKGDGKEYFVRMLSADVQDYNYHHFVFRAGKDWQKFRVPFSQFVQFEWGDAKPWSGERIKGLMITNYNAPGEEAGAIEFSLDEVSLF
jgi:hypothetical protein